MNKALCKNLQNIEIAIKLKGLFNVCATEVKNSGSKSDKKRFRKLT